MSRYDGFGAIAVTALMMAADRWDHEEPRIPFEVDPITGKQPTSTPSSKRKQALLERSKRRAMMEARK